MFKNILFLLVLSLILATGACKKGDKKHHPKPPGVPVTPTPSTCETDYPGTCNCVNDGFEFWEGGYYGRGLGDSLSDVTPLELMLLQIHFDYDFLASVAELSSSYTLPAIMKVELFKKGTGTKITSATFSTSSAQYLTDIVRVIYNKPADNYYLVTKYSSYGKTKCAGPLKLGYTGQDHSQIITQAPGNIQVEEGCRYFDFKIPNFPDDLFGVTGGFLSNIEVYRSTSCFNSPAEAQETMTAHIPYSFNNPTCNASMCEYFVSLSSSSWYTDGYIGVRVRDSDGRLSPMSKPIACVSSKPACP